MKPWHAALLLALAVAGSILGAVTTETREADAATQVVINVAPGPQDSNPHFMNCGWHVECLPPYTTGRGIDFRNPAGSQVNWRSNANVSTAVGSAIAASATVTGSSFGCNSISVRLIDGFGTWRGTVRFVHSDKGPSLSFFSVLGSNFGLNQQTTVGSSSGTDSDCGANTAPHLHEAALSLPELLFNNYPTALQNHTDGVNRNSVWSTSNRLFQTSWTQ